MLPLNQLEASLPGGSEVEESRRRACIEGVGWEGGGSGGVHGWPWFCFTLYCELLYIGYAFKCNY